MSTLGGGPGQLAMAGYGGGLPQPGQGGQQQQRKSLFAPYLPQASIPPLLSANKLVIGVLRVVSALSLRTTSPGERDGSLTRFNSLVEQEESLGRLCRYRRA